MTKESETIPETEPITDDAVSTLNAATEQITRLCERIATLEKALRDVVESNRTSDTSVIRAARAALSGEHQKPHTTNFAIADYKDDDSEV